MRVTSIVTRFKGIIGLSLVGRSESVHELLIRYFRLLLGTEVPLPWKKILLNESG